MSRVREALAGARRDLGRAWTPRRWLLVLALALAAAIPLWADGARVETLAAGLLLVLAVVGLQFAVGLGGLPSLGQGAFMAIGAFGAALLRARAGWDPTLATLAAPVLAAAAGLVVGAGAVRLRTPFVAVATWVVAWLTAFALQAFPVLSGGARGIALPPADLGLPGARLAMTPAAVYWLALGLVVVVLMLQAGVVRGAPGRALAAVRSDPAAAAALGIPVRGMRLGAFTAAAGVGGLAGALLVQHTGVADLTTFGPLRSVELLLAVLIGGTASLAGPVVGAAVLAAIGPAAETLGRGFGVPAEPLQPVVAAALLLVALAAGRGGLVALVPARPGSPEPEEEEPARPVLAEPEAEPAVVVLRARGIQKRFGGVTALGGVDLEARSGEIHALVGPNGSGKSTLLAILSGAVPADAGSVWMPGGEAGTQTDRVRAGVVRVLQRTAVFEDLTVVEHVEAGSWIRRRSGGAVRAALATPRAREEAARFRASARARLTAVGLADPGIPASALSGGERRLLMLATAWAAEPRVLLLDEPSSGMAGDEVDRFRSALDAIRREGIATILVEHDFHLVHGVADRVTVLDAGRVLAEGAPGVVARDPRVVEAYLGAESA